MTGAARQNVARIVSGVVGLALIGYLVKSSGPERIARVLANAAWWLPLVFALELVQIANDVVALRWLLKGAPGEVTAGTWLRSSATAYAMMVLLPAGRAAGEVARATLTARHVGAAWAATASTQLQVSYLFANGVFSAFAFVAVSTWLGLRSSLSLLLAGNTLLMGTFAAALLAILRGEQLGRLIERMRRRFMKRSAPSVALEPAARRRTPWGAIVSCIASRGLQTVQYAVLLRAVGGTSSVQNAFIAHGIHLVGTTAGDFLPNQLGAVDGAYRAFAAALGFADSPARALSIPFLAHAVQLSCAAACVVVAAITRRVDPVAAPPSGDRR